MAGIAAVHAQEKAEARFNGAVTPRGIAMGVGKAVIIDLPMMRRKSSSMGCPLGRRWKTRGRGAAQLHDLALIRELYA
jgi:hypothetical protein